MIRYVHGSADSTDLDVVYVFEEMPSFDVHWKVVRKKGKELATIYRI